MAIRQFNGTWSNREDRIELRFNTTENEEFRFWLTRFLTGKLIESADSMVGDLLKKHYENERTAEVIQEFQKDSIKSTADFQTSYKGADKTPLGDNPTLVVGLSFTPIDQLIAVELQLESKTRVNFSISQEMLQSLVLLLESLADKAGWRLESESKEVTGIKDSTTQVQFGKKVLH